MQITAFSVIIRSEIVEFKQGVNGNEIKKYVGKLNNSNDINSVIKSFALTIFIAPKIVNDNSAKSCFDGDSLEKIADCKKFKIYEAQLVGGDVLLKYITNVIHPSPLMGEGPKGR